jgi:hypothetical protein
MTRTLRTIFVSLAALALLAPVAATADSGKGKSDAAKTRHAAKAPKAKNAEFFGTVTAVDAAAGSVTVHVDKASKWGRSLKGQDVVFTTATVKKIKVADTNADGKKDLNDVKVGDRAHAGAKILKGAVSPIAARKLHVKAPKAPKPEPTPTATPAAG